MNKVNENFSNDNKMRQSPSSPPPVKQKQQHVQHRDNNILIPTKTT